MLTSSNEDDCITTTTSNYDHSELEDNTGTKVEIISLQTEDDKDEGDVVNGLSSQTKR